MSAQDAQQGHMVPIAFGAQNSANQGDSVSEHVVPTLDKSKTPAVLTIFQDSQFGVAEYESSGTIRAGRIPEHQMVICATSAVRRLTPRECERLQGFPDDYTLIQYRGKDAADGPRYKAMGNSMAVPVMRWIGQRINEVDKIK